MKYDVPYLWLEKPLGSTQDTRFINESGWAFNLAAHGW